MTHLFRPGGGVLLCAALVLAAVACFSQVLSNDLYVPLNVKTAFQKGTRKKNGSVSPTYWQNRSSYRINAQIFPKQRKVDGDATIQYFNNSPDTLRQIVFHAYDDYYKLGSIRRSVTSPEQDKEIITEGFQLKSLSVDGEVIDVKGKAIRKEPTCYVVTLTKPLPPRGVCRLSIVWTSHIPGKGFIRSGASDSTSMFVAQWYPEIAVYDDIDGWDKIVYDGPTEFYHDFSDYDVTVTAPNDFLIWASVAADNIKEILPDQIFSRLAKAKQSATPVMVVEKGDVGKVRVKLNSWKFTAKDFPDFAFAISDHYVWESVNYKDQFGEYQLNSAYDPKNTSFKAVIENEVAAIKLFHSTFPRYKFPFSYFTIFNGESGMEYPGMAHDIALSREVLREWMGQEVEVNDFDANMGLSTHEMVHSYFPFLMGINEKKYAWMDEGFATFSEVFLPHGFRGNENIFLADHVAPVMAPSHLGLGVNSYYFGAYSYQALFQLLGEQKFTSTMKTYMDTWKFKHPTPYDFMFTFNQASGQNLNWFWKSWYFDWGYPDLGIERVSNGEIAIKNEGGKPLAFKIVLTYSDNSSESEVISPVVWKDLSLFTRKIDRFSDLISVSLRPAMGEQYDAVRANDNWSKK